MAQTFWAPAVRAAGYRTYTLQRVGSEWMLFEDGDRREDPRYIGAWPRKRRAMAWLEREGARLAGTRRVPFGDATQTVEVWCGPA